MSHPGTETNHLIWKSLPVGKPIVYQGPAGHPYAAHRYWVPLGPSQTIEGLPRFRDKTIKFVLWGKDLQKEVSRHPLSAGLQNLQPCDAWSLLIGQVRFYYSYRPLLSWLSTELAYILNDMSSDSADDATSTNMRLDYPAVSLLPANHSRFAQLAIQGSACNVTFLG